MHTQIQSTVTVWKPSLISEHRECYKTPAKKDANFKEKYPISSSDEDRPRARNILSVSIVFGPRPSCALKTAVSACAAIP